MSIYNRIRVIEQKAESLKMKEIPMFFDSVEEYQRALENGIIKAHHICFVDDVAN